MFNIVLFTPDIPNNTGAIGRICVNTDSTLHLIKPLGFDIDEKSVRRAGLDYWHLLDLNVWSSWEEFTAVHPVTEHFFFSTTKTKKIYSEAKFETGDFLVFGSETKGMPDEILQKYPKQNITIPMSRAGRSLNLAVSSGIVLYEAIRQNLDSFKELM